MDGEHAEYNILSRVQHHTGEENLLAPIFEIRLTETGRKIKNESIECRP